MGKPRVFIRTDGNETIGLGHLTRCMALALAISDLYEIAFFCLSIPEKIVDELKKFSFYKINNDNEFINALDEETIVVLDGYHIEFSLEIKIKTIGAKLVRIDDLADKPTLADLIINHAPGTQESFYSAQPYTKFALGPKYALIRPLFVMAAKKKRHIKSIESVMICFGGADPQNHSMEALQAIINTIGIKSIYIVVGAAYRHWDHLLLEAIKHKQRVKLYQNIDESKMINVIFKSDLAIVSSSSILFETIAIGCNNIICYSAENQKKYHDYLVNECQVVTLNQNGIIDFSKLDEYIKQYQINKNPLLAQIRKDMSYSSINLLESFKNL